MVLFGKLFDDRRSSDTAFRTRLYRPQHQILLRYLQRDQVAQDSGGLTIQFAVDRLLGLGKFSKLGVNAPKLDNKLVAPLSKLSGFPRDIAWRATWDHDSGSFTMPASAAQAAND